MYLEDGTTWLRYIRYADDFILGFAGTKREAIEIKEKIANFLKTIKLTLSEEKTLITNAREKRARFLNYEIATSWSNTRISKSRGGDRRAINGNIKLNVPADVVDKWKARVTKAGKVIQRAELLKRSDYDIVAMYEAQVQGLINYYELAHDGKYKMRNVQ